MLAEALDVHTSTVNQYMIHTRLTYGSGRQPPLHLYRYHTYYEMDTCCSLQQLQCIEDSEGRAESILMRASELRLAKV